MAASATSFRRVAELAALVATLGACSTSAPAGDGVVRPLADRVASGEAQFAALCRTCHGPSGEGATGPSLRAWTRGEAELVRTIDARMPLGNPAACDGDCPKDVAAFILAKLQGELSCDASPTSPRRLRLLTRREYQATVADLLGPVSPVSSGTSACAPTTFTYAPGGRAVRTVHVAGAFNGWAKTIAAGGWALAPSASGWSLSRAIAPGTYAYKLVIDETDWLVDVANPARAPDGLGGDNSLLTVQPCVSTSPPAATVDVTAGFPPEARPDGFPFDDSASARVVTAVHAEEFLRAAAALAAAAAPRLAADVGDGVKARGLRACADEFVRGFGLRAFRRPPTDAELVRYADLVTSAGDLTRGIAAAVAAMLASPHFLYRSEIGEPQGDGTFRLTGWEVASALSYMFWGTMPDAALFDAARKGELGPGAAGIEREARRLLADPRARAVVGTFAVQWLGAERVGEVNKAEPFPAELRASMLEETRRFVTHVVFDGSHALGELFTADYTFMDARLATHYGAAGVTGDGMRRVPSPGRSGVLGHASVLATTAHSDQTSPIRRGLFVRRALLCQEFPPPPPNAGGVPKVDPAATTRERFRQHTDNATCRTCHQYIDDVGFGFERFDPLGRLRDAENGKPIDARGDMNDVEALGSGTHAPYADLASLGRTLAASQAARACFVKQVYRFARGADPDEGARCAVKSLVERTRAHGDDVRELLVGVALSPELVERR